MTDEPNPPRADLAATEQVPLAVTGGYLLKKLERLKVDFASLRSALLDRQEERAALVSTLQKAEQESEKRFSQLNSRIFHLESALERLEARLQRSED